MARLLNVGPGLETGAWHRDHWPLADPSSVTTSEMAANVGQTYFKYAHRGTDTPDFHQRRKRGEIIPMTSWWQYEQSGGRNDMRGSWDQSPSERSEYYGLGGDLSDEHIWLPTDLSSWVPNADYNALVAQAAAAIYAAGFDGGTFLAELHKTHRLFRNFLQRFIELVRTGQAHRLWLEARYGWRILILEMQDLQRTLVEFDESRDRYKQRVGYSTTEVETSVITTTDNPFVLREIEVRTQITRSLRGSVIMDVKPPKFSFNPILTAWEVIPYSFVIDWFVGIGTWFESLSALSMSSSAAAAGGYKVEVRRDWSTVTFDLKQPGWDGSWNESGTVVAEETRRIPTTIPKLPQLGRGLTGLRTIDLLALLYQVLRK